MRFLSQGDGVDWESIPKILEKLKKEKIAAEPWKQAVLPALMLHPPRVVRDWVWRFRRGGGGAGGPQTPRGIRGPFSEVVS